LRPAWQMAADASPPLRRQGSVLSAIPSNPVIWYDDADE
jgi:hypothetical protein